MEMGHQHAKIVVPIVQIVAIILVIIIVQMVVLSIAVMTVQLLVQEDVCNIVLQHVNQQFEYRTK